MVNFSEYIEKNLQLYTLRNDGLKLSTKAQANFCRSELASALRRAPQQVNLLLGGYDEKDEAASLYFLDYMGSLVKVPYGCQGYAANFCMSTMDRECAPVMDEAAAIAVVEKCIHELRTRFLIAQHNFIIKIIDKEGVRVHSHGADPADT